MQGSPPSHPSVYQLNETAQVWHTGDIYLVQSCPLLPILVPTVSTICSTSTVLMWNSNAVWIKLDAGIEIVFLQEAWEIRKQNVAFRAGIYHEKCIHLLQQ